MTLNQAAYIAGKANKVKAVATINPPMMATAIGPQKTLLERGIMAKTAAAAVKTMGRKRLTADSTMASQAAVAAAMRGDAALHMEVARFCQLRSYCGEHRLVLLGGRMARFSDPTVLPEHIKEWFHLLPPGQHGQQSAQGSPGEEGS